MFKFIRKKLIEGLIKDITKELPEIKEKAIVLLNKHKEQVIEAIKETIKDKIRELVEKN